MQDFALYSVYKSRNINNRKEIIEMKTMKLWRIAFVMLAAFSLASCSSDDDNDVYEAAELGGTWQKVYDEGVADAGMVQYTFHPQSANNGTVDIFTSDWAAGDTTVYRIYTVSDAGRLHISPKPDDTSVALTVDCDIRRLTSTQMIWNKPGTSDHRRLRHPPPHQHADDLEQARHQRGNSSFYKREISLSNRSL